MDTRFQVRREADKQKQMVMHVFDKMKAKGKIDGETLKKLGLDVEIKEEPKAEGAGEKEADVRQRHANEMKSLLAEEKQIEISWDSTLHENPNDEALKAEYEREKAKCSDRIAALKAKHEAELREFQHE